MDVKYDSFEEYYFSEYLRELKVAGYIKEYFYHSAPFLLSSSVDYLTKKITKRKHGSGFNVESRMLLRQHSYKCDFLILWNTHSENLFYSRLDGFITGLCPFMAQQTDSGIVSYVDIKGGFSQSQLSSDAQFPLNQKWVYQRYGVYVQKVVLVARKKKRSSIEYSGLFPETFVPSRYLLTDQEKRNRTINFNYRLLKDYLHYQKLKSWKTEEN